MGEIVQNIHKFKTLSFKLVFIPALIISPSTNVTKFCIYFKIDIFFIYHSEMIMLYFLVFVLVMLCWDNEFPCIFPLSLSLDIQTTRVPCVTYLDCLPGEWYLSAVPGLPLYPLPHNCLDLEQNKPWPRPTASHGSISRVRVTCKLAVFIHFYLALLGHQWWQILLS